MQVLGHVGIALGTAFGALLNGATLWTLLHRRGYFLVDARLKRRLPRILLATLVMTAALKAADYAVRGAGLEIGWGLLAAAIALALAVFLAVGLAIGAVARDDLSILTRRRRPTPDA
jgi:putative peptidoglycan lipid II flippase